jgi:hypothetical protein
MDLKVSAPHPHLGLWRKDRMRKEFFLTFSIALFLFSWNPSVMAKAPRMILEEHFFDAREVKEGELITHTFRVLNGGDETLRIRAVTSD